MNATTFAIPTLEADGLRMRAPMPADFEAYAAFCASPRSAGIGGPFSRDDAFRRLSAIVGHWHLRGFGIWMVADGATDAPLGAVGCFFPESWPEPEIAWSVFGHAEGRGIAYRAAKIARAYAYDTLGWTTAVSAIVQENERSTALARRLGCQIDGVYDHPVHGPLNVWRHPGPEALP